MNGVRLSLEETRVLRKRSARRRARAALPVYVSNDHNGALTNLHRAIRCRELALHGVGMLHVDSHPDLMVNPSMPADVVFRPRELHQCLSNSETGIAEFLLPAVYAGHLDRLLWLRPPWSDQIRDGEQSFLVGNAPLGWTRGVTGAHLVTSSPVDDQPSPSPPTRGPLRVSCTAPYFSDEDLDAPAEVLEFSRPLRLFVSPLRPTTHDDASAFLFAAGVSSSPIQESAAVLAPAAASSPASAEAAHLQAQQHAKHHAQQHSQQHAQQHSQQHAQQPRAQPREWVLDICLDYFSVSNPFRADWFKRAGEADGALLLEAYCGADVRWRRMEERRTRTADDSEAATLRPEQVALKAAFDAAMARLYARAASHAEANADHEACAQLAECYHDVRAGSLLAARLLAMLRQGDDAWRAAAQQCGPNLDLPHHVSDDATVDTMVGELRDMLQAMRRAQAEPEPARPSIVTVAKSSSDDFDYTPRHQMARILLATLDMLRALYGELDIEEDPESDRG